MAGKFDYGDVNDADSHAVAELQVGFGIVAMLMVKQKLYIAIRFRV